MQNNCKSWYEKSYTDKGSKAQRRYPNEECCRFVGRKFSNLSKIEKGKLTCLEVGCGSGSNLWMLIEEGFKVTGLDISENSLKVCKSILEQKNLNIPNLNCASMIKIPLENESQDFIVDIFSSNCLTLKDFDDYLNEAYRVLKNKGSIFIYTPSKKSDAFLNPGNASLLDKSTLDGVFRESSPYCGNHYPFRFEHIEELETKLLAKGFEINYSELVSRTYRRCSEYFEFITLEAIKK